MRKKETTNAMVRWRRHTHMGSWIGTEVHDGREKHKNNRNIGPKS